MWRSLLTVIAILLTGCGDKKVQPENLPKLQVRQGSPVTPLVRSDESVGSQTLTWFDENGKRTEEISSDRTLTQQAIYSNGVLSSSVLFTRYGDTIDGHEILYDHTGTKREIRTFFSGLWVERQYFSDGRPTGTVSSIKTRTEGTMENRYRDGRPYEGIFCFDVPGKEEVLVRILDQGIPVEDRRIRWGFLPPIGKQAPTPEELPLGE